MKAILGSGKVVMSRAGEFIFGKMAINTKVIG